MGKILSLLVLVFIFGLTLGSVSAASDVKKLVVNGVVRNAYYFEPMEGVKVTITCNGNYSLSDMTKEDGSYAVIFPDFHSCGLGSSLSGEARYVENLVAIQNPFKIECGNFTLCSIGPCNSDPECTDNSLVVLLNFTLGAFSQPPATVVGGRTGKFVVPVVIVNNSASRIGITGAAIGTLNGDGIKIISVFIALLIVIFVTFKVIRRKISSN